MLEELSLSTNRGSQLFQQRQRRMQRFVFEHPSGYKKVGAQPQAAGCPSTLPSLPHRAAAGQPRSLRLKGRRGDGSAVWASTKGVPPVPPPTPLLPPCSSQRRVARTAPRRPGWRGRRTSGRWVAGEAAAPPAQRDGAPARILLVRVLSPEPSLHRLGMLRASRASTRSCTWRHRPRVAPRRCPRSRRESCRWAESSTRTTWPQVSARTPKPTLLGSTGTPGSPPPSSGPGRRRCERRAFILLPRWVPGGASPLPCEVTGPRGSSPAAQPA